MFEVKDLVIIVTGSSGGNGSAISKKLQELGANIIDCDLPKYDVTKDEDLNRVVQNALKINGQINGLVNCAGVTYGSIHMAGKDPIIIHKDRSDLLYSSASDVYATSVVYQG